MAYPKLKKPLVKLNVKAMSLLSILISRYNSFAIVSQLGGGFISKRRKHHGIPLVNLLLSEWSRPAGGEWGH